MGGALAAQSSSLEREREDLAQWLSTAPLSPFAAVALHPIGTGLTVGGSSAEVPLAGLSRGQVIEENGLAIFVHEGRRRALPRGRPVTIGPYTFLVAGSRGRGTLAVFGAHRQVRAPTYFPTQPALAATSRLESAPRREPFRVLGLDGLETQAFEAGFVTVSVSGQPVRLRVYRLGESEDDEAGLYVFFQDSTNGEGSYPGGRFVELTPRPGGQYEIDFNRARNPFCAYSTVFPCPAPWPGNRIGAPVPAGERYLEDAK